MLHRFLWVFFILLLVWIPIPLGSNRPWAWTIFEYSAFFLLFGCVFLRRHNNWLGLAEYRIPIFLWLGFLFICILQIIPLPTSIVDLISPHRLSGQISPPSTWQYLSIDVGQSQVSFIKTLGYFCIFICSLILINSHKRLQQLLLVLLICGTFQAIYGALEILSGRGFSLVFDFPIGQSATGSFVYKNHFANYLLLCLSAGLGLMVTDTEIKRSHPHQDWRISAIQTLLSQKAVIRICLAIIVIALVMSRSRMGNVAFFSALIAVSVFTFSLERNKSKGLIILIVSMLVIDLFIVSKWFGLEQVQQRLIATSLNQEMRDEVVLDALPMFQNYPITGIGAGSFYGMFPAHKSKFYNSFYDHAHNDYLQILIEFGVLGFICLGLLLLFAFVKAVKALKKNINPTAKGTAFACLLTYIGMLIHMSVDFPLQAPAIAVYFVVFITLPLLLTNNMTQR